MLVFWLTVGVGSVVGCVRAANTMRQVIIEETARFK